jgi:hypothetical protein
MGWFGGSGSSEPETPKDFSSSDDSAFSAASAPMSSQASTAGMGSTGLQQFAAEAQQKAMVQQVRRWEEGGREHFEERRKPLDDGRDEEGKNSV